MVKELSRIRNSRIEHSSSKLALIRRATFAAVAVVIGSYLTGVAQPSLIDQRSWAISDSIAVRYFITNWNAPGEWPTVPGNPVVPSPDKQHFFTVSYSGDLQNDSVTYELRVYDSEDIRTAFDKRPIPSDGVSPRQSVAMQSTSSTAPGIREARWVNNETIFFFGLEKKVAGVFWLNIKNGALTKQAIDGEDVIQFDVSAKSIILVTAKPLPKASRYPVVEFNDPRTLERVANPLPSDHREYSIYTSYDDKPFQKLGALRDLSPMSMTISPNGKLAILDYEPADIPAPGNWKQYVGWPPDPPFLSMRRGRLMLFDLEKRTVATLLNAPSGWATSNATSYGTMSSGSDSILMPNVFWTENSEHAALVNTALPLDEDIETRRRMGYLLDYDLETRKYATLEPIVDETKDYRVVEVGWLVKGKDLLVRHIGVKDDPINRIYGEPRNGTVYSFVGDHWVSRTVPASVRLPSDQERANGPIIDNIIVKLREDANTPPYLEASNGDGKLRISDSDPALKNVWRAPAQIVEWKERGGYLAKGLLMLPKDFDRKHPPPLVIQTYKFLPDLFRPDGHSPTAYAAQALVAQGIAVLQVQLYLEDRIQGLDSSKRDFSKEGPGMVERIDAAVKSLAERGLVDPDRIGLIGFSRGGFDVYYSITNPGTTRILASVVADCFTGNFGEYLRIAIRNAETRNQFERLYDSKSFWRDKKTWIDHAPSFNVDRVQGATFFAWNNIDSAPLLEESVGAFVLNKKPFDFQIILEGDHQLKRPKERFASMSATVDWFNFWLQGTEDPDAAKAQKYQRWRKLRADWEKARQQEVAAPSTR
jgi:dipeptidyl aminopeptidase/acylaminoacyl peptidase